MKTLIFAYTKKGLNKLIKKSKRRNTILVSLKPEIDFILTKKNIKYKSIKDYNIKPLDYKNIFMKRQQTFSSWGQQKAGKQTIQSILTIKGLPLWNVIEQEAGGVNLDTIIIYANIIQSIISAERPDMIITNKVINAYLIPRDKIVMYLLIKQCANKNDTPFKILNTYGRINVPFQKIIELLIDIGKKLRFFQRKFFRNFILHRNNRRVLFFLYGLGMDKTVQIQKNLQEKGVDAITICGQGLLSNQCLEVLKKERARYAHYEYFTNKKIIKLANKHKAFIKKTWVLIRTRKIRFEYAGIDLFPVYEHQLKYFFKKQLPEIVLMFFTFNQIYKKLKPNLIVTINETIPYSKTAVLSAKKIGIKTLLIQHAKSMDTATCINPISDYVLLWNQKDLKRISKKNIDKFIVTGSPKENTLKRAINSYNKKRIKSELGIKSRDVIILFAARFPVTRDLFRIDGLLRHLKDKKNILLIVKIHPAEVKTDIEKYFKQFKKKVIFLKRFDFTKLLKIADIVISTRECTTASDAIMADKPLILIDYNKTFDQTLTDIPTYLSDTPFIIAKNDLQLITSLDKLSKNKRERAKLIKKMQEFNQKHGNNKQSDKNIIRIILEIIRNT